MAQVTNPHMVFDEATGTWGTAPKEPTPAAAPSARATGLALVRTPPAPAGAPLPVGADRVAQEQNRQILNRGGVQCPYCAHAFFLPSTDAVSSEPMDEAEPLARGPQQVMEAARHEPLPGEEPEDEMEVEPDLESSGQSAGHPSEFWRSYTDAEKIKVLQRLELAENDGHLEQVVSEIGIPNDTLSDWMSAWRQGEMEGEPSPTPHL
ncbi:MAG: hypothetical protein OXH68_15245 [Gammaproteobacteria bacterium]|nr:hypothetical protein [Gammaproteobacteria bacterium]